MENKTKASWHYLVLIILAGESIFFLPYVLCRVFRPTVLEVFQIDNIQLGICFSVYGFVAIGSYLLGGPIADKYPPRKLIAIALWLTSIGGLVYANYPSYTVLKILYGYWGFTTVLLFWAPMIKATRIWGGSASQLKAFGYLEGGRGLFGALLGALGVMIFAFFMKGNNSAGLNESRDAFKYVIYISSFIVAFVGVLVWFFMKLDKDQEKNEVLDKISISQIVQVIKLPSVLLLMIVVLCAYMGYKTTDIISLYAKEIMLYDQVESAQIATFLLYTRPVISIVIAIFLYKLKGSLLLIYGFAISFLSALLFSMNFISHSATFLFIISILILAIGVYGLRVLYFSVMEKGLIPLIFTGTAVGVISVSGYAPDIFSGPMIGYFLENFEGKEGYQYVFLILAGFSFIGGVASWKYHKLYGSKTH